MEIPTGPQALTTEWLTDALRERSTISQANVNSFEIEALGDKQGITGQLARLILSYDNHEEDAPQSLIAKFPATDAAARNTFRGHYIREVRFYEELASKAKLRTPRCYYNALDVQTGDAKTGDAETTAAVTGSQVALLNKQSLPSARLQNFMPPGGTVQTFPR
jgi:hypothetical protein